MMIPLSRMPLMLSLLAAAVAALPAQERRRIRVVTTLPVLADVARAVGGDAVEVRALARATEDPHYVVATPSLMSAVNKADLFVEIGMSLEIWAENVLDGARNPNVRRGAPGHVVASAGVHRLAVPKVLSRAAGDIHPQGNPHIWLDPVVVRKVAANIHDGLCRVAPDRTELFDERLHAYQHRLDVALFGRQLVDLLGGEVLARLARGYKLIDFLESKRFRGKPLADRLGGWLAKARPLRGRKVVFYHERWIYLARRFGIHIVGYVEDKPGILPSAAHRDELLRTMLHEGVKMIGVTNYYDDTVPRELAAATGARVVILPGDVGGVEGTGDYFSFLDTVLSRLLGEDGEH